MSSVREQLVKIVGKSYLSDAPEERFIYSRDPGLQEPHYPDFVVMPDSVEEVQEIVQLANAEKIPVVPMGGGLVLSGLTIPLQGGIVLDMKRMNRVLAVNEMSRYAVIEGGASQGMLKAYLEKHHPALKHSLPDAPPIATIAGNIAIHGSGHLSQSEGGFHSEMVTGLEVVLPTGEVVKLGSCSTVPGWFSRAPLPDLVGLFLGWNGTTGIITKVGVKLFPKPQLEDVLIFMTDDVENVPDVITRVTATELAEDLTLSINPKPDWLRGFQLTIVNLVANSESEMKFKKRIIIETLSEGAYFQNKDAGFLPLPPNMKSTFMDVPQKILSSFADVMKGGGFEYVGSIMPVEKLPEACQAGIDIAERNDVEYSLGARVIGRAHCIMFFNAYPFNRADPDNMTRAAQALEDTNEVALQIGGIPWKAEYPAQQQILKQMDPNTYRLMKRIKKVLDPNGIMNPGNWEVETHGI